MPYVISDELYEGLMENLRECRLLGIMARLEKLRTDAEFVEPPVVAFDGYGREYNFYQALPAEVAAVRKEQRREREADGD